MKGAICLFGLMVAFAIWNFSSGMEIGATTIWGDILWAKIEYLGSATVPVLFFIFALQFTDNDKYLSRRRAYILWIVPVVTILLVFTNEFHNLIWSAVLPNNMPGVVRFLYYHGIWFWIFTVYSYILLVFATILLVMQAARQKSIYRQQSHVLLMGIPLPWISNLMYISGHSLVPWFDLTPIMFSITGILYTLGLYRFELLDLIPVARNKIFEDLEDGLMVLDLKQRIIDLNSAAGVMLHLRTSEVIGKPLSVESPMLAGLLSRNAPLVEFQSVPDSNQWLEMRVSPLVDGSRKDAGTLITLRDISNRKRTEQELEIKSRELKVLAEMDSLTRLYNRRYGEKALELEILQSGESGSPLAMGEVDLDNFKGINDRYGHIFGDKVLQEVADEFTSGTRGQDVVARMGGDEFIIIFRNTHISEAIQAMERLRQKVEQHRFSGVKDPLTFSAGVILCRPGDTTDSALRRVDKLLYKAKRAGRNRVISEAK